MQGAIEKLQDMSILMGICQEPCACVCVCLCVCVCVLFIYLPILMGICQELGVLVCKVTGKKYNDAFFIDRICSHIYIYIYYVYIIYVCMYVCMYTYYWRLLFLSFPPFLCPVYWERTRTSSLEGFLSGGLSFCLFSLSLFGRDGSILFATRWSSPFD